MLFLRFIWPVGGHGGYAQVRYDAISSFKETDIRK